MSVGKGSILRASNANAAVKEKKTAPKAATGAVINSTQVQDKTDKSEKVQDIPKKIQDIPTKITDRNGKLSDMVTKVPVDACKQVPKTWGVTVVDVMRVESLKESIQAYGMLVPIIVYKNRKQELLVLKGNHRLAAAKAVGLKEVPVFFVEVATDAQAKEIHVELRSFEKDDNREKEYEVVSSITVNMPSYLL